MPVLLFVSVVSVGLFPDGAAAAVECIGGIFVFWRAADQVSDFRMQQFFFWKTARRKIKII